MKKLKLNNNDYIMLRNIVSNGTERKELEIFAQAISSDHKYSRMTFSDPHHLNAGEIGVDQTLREALALKIGDKVILSTTDKKHGLMEKFLALLDYQKAVVRIQANAAYMEHKIPVVCLCEEVIATMGAAYGDTIEVESNNNKIVSKTAKLTTSMQEFHDFVLDRSNSEIVNARLTAGYFLDPSSFGIKSERLNQGEMTHPIFMDATAMYLLGFMDARLHPVKVRKSLWWQIQKKLNSFGNVSLIAFSVTLGLFVQNPSVILLVWSVVLGTWGSWSVLTSSSYKTSNET